MLGAMLIEADRSMVRVSFKFLLYAVVSRKNGGKNLPVEELWAKLYQRYGVGYGGTSGGWQHFGVTYAVRRSGRGVFKKCSRKVAQLVEQRTHELACCRGFKSPFSDIAGSLPDDLRAGRMPQRE